MKIKSLLGILGIVLFAASCKDMVDADDNISVKKYEYNHVLGNQTTSVIMPLKLDYRWYYNHEKYENGKVVSTNLDSIYVVETKLINDELWFGVSVFSDAGQLNKRYYSNTDMGLWMKCDCESKSSLQALYPVRANSFIVDSFPTIIVDNGLPVNDTAIIVCNITEDVSVTVPVGSFKCIAYQTKAFTKKTSGISRVTITYYCPNVGIIKQEMFDFTSIYPTDSYSLTAKSF